MQAKLFSELALVISFLSLATNQAAKLHGSDVAKLAYIVGACILGTLFGDSSCDIP